MKYLLSGMILIVTACSCANNSSDRDPKTVADSTNNAKIDSAKTADTLATAAGRMAEMKPDASFATEAADGGMMEVALGKLAVSNGMSKEIKSLGAMMVKDHSMLNMELEAAAKKKGIALPVAMSDKCNKEVAELSQKTGKDFDKAYADLMVSDHKEDIEAFKKEADKGTDKDFAKWANDKITILQHHLAKSEEAKKILAK